MIFPVLLSFMIDLRKGASFGLISFGGAIVRSVPLQAITPLMTFSGNIS